MNEPQTHTVTSAPSTLDPNFHIASCSCGWVSKAYREDDLERIKANHLTAAYQNQD